jgi:hypothetical protein
LRPEKCTKLTRPSHAGLMFRVLEIGRKALKLYSTGAAGNL